MIDQLLYTAVLMSPEIGSAANSAFKQWAKQLAREMANEAVQEAVAQTKSALPIFLQNGISSIAGDLTPRIEKMAAETAEGILGKHLAGHAIVPLALFEAQIAVVEAARSGVDIAGALAKLDAVQKRSPSPETT